MKNIALKFLFAVIFILACVYSAFFILLPSNLSIVQGDTLRLDTLVPVSFSANAQTEGNIEYDFSSMEIKGKDSGKSNITLNVCGVPVKKVSVNVLPYKRLVPIGTVEGIVLHYDGMLVVGTGKVETENSSTSPCKGILKTGDIILKIDDKKPESKQEVADIVQESNGEKINITIKRKDEIKQVSVVPVFSKAEDCYKIGCWIRSDTQGLGTITFMDRQTGNFAALGHGVYDADAENLLAIKGGEITKAIVSGINKGQKGVPGEVMGALDKSENMGTVEKNTSCGISGKINTEKYSDMEEMAVAASSEVKEGKAYILSDAVSGNIEKYQIEIEHLTGFGADADKSMIICVTDEKLIEKTGGIVQGMSGSPIIQNGKLIGAVTHVFVNEPTKGYGIFIENML